MERARARLDAEVARRLREFDRSCEWAAHGSRSAAAFLVTNTRCARGEAHRRVRVAREVEALDQTAEAWATGALTTRHVDTITQARRAARADSKFDAFEPALVEVARAGSPEDVSGAVRQWRDALDAELDRDGANRETICERQWARRSVDYGKSIDGIGLGTITLEPEGADIFNRALRRADEDLHRAGDPRTPTQQRADALVEIARAYLGGKPSRANLPHMLVLTDPPTLRGDHVGECRVADGTRISPDTARRIACDANIQELVIDETGVPLALGRSARTFTPDQFRAMVARDGGCRCCGASPELCDAHHVDEWNDQGPTDIDNGMLLCRYGCHRGMHEGHWKVVGNPNRRLDFSDRDGNHIATSEPQPRVEPIPTRQGRQRAHLEQLTRTRLDALRLAA
ncbi:MAG TPA: DUF222 domain-containing protein [Acidimicrobiia bacterium]|nr:DUF222 domain-containing protein [Acidimicrobiia bacterium]